MKWKNHKENVIIIGVILYLVFLLGLVSADPIPPTIITNISKSTMGASGSIGTKFNETGNGTHAGGYIFTINIQSKVQNKRWKAFVGNISATLTLDDGDGYTVFDWSSTIESLNGEVYATRSPNAVNWSNINCTWGYRDDPNEYQNKTVIENENQAMFLNSSDDNITTTFSQYNHSQLQIGSITIPANNCSSLKTYVNSTAGGPYNEDIFTEVILYDGNNETNGKIVYATVIDASDQYAYRNDTYTYYDFQMIVPENGSASWNSATAYYFYVELE